MALPVLLEAERLVKEQGFPVGRTGEKTPGILLTVALQNGELLANEYARNIVRGLLWEWNLVEWEQHPSRWKGEVLRVLRRAVVYARGRLPHAGGWRIGEVRS